MSDSTMPHEGNTDVSGENTDGFKPVTSQEDLDRIIENRLMREHKKFAAPVSHSHFKKCEPGLMAKMCVQNRCFCWFD